MAVRRKALFGKMQEAIDSGRNPPKVNIRFFNFVRVFTVLGRLKRGLVIVVVVRTVGEARLIARKLVLEQRKVAQME